MLKYYILQKKERSLGEVHMKRYCSSNFKFIAFITVFSLIFLLSTKQTSWADLIYCPSTGNLCNGTSGDDIIYGGFNNPSQVIQGLGGNDWIMAAPTTQAIFGNEGNDTLLGSNGNDHLYGGPGSDKMDGGPGDDNFEEYVNQEGTLVNNDDIISGGEGIDRINSGVGADRIHGGPGNDLIWPDGAITRDFAVDSVNCGADTQDRIFFFHSADGDTTVNCELVNDLDR